MKTNTGINLNNLAQRFANCSPKATNFNNSKKDKYFTSITKGSESQKSTIREFDDELFNQNQNKKRKHKNSLSRHSYILKINCKSENPNNKNQQKYLYKLPAKNLNDDEDNLSDGISDYEVDFDGNNNDDELETNRIIDDFSQLPTNTTVIHEENSKNFSKIDGLSDYLLNITNFDFFEFSENLEIFQLIDEIYVNLIKNFDTLERNFYVNNFKLIEKWFDLSSRLELYYNDNGIIFNKSLKYFQIYEIVFFSLILSKDNLKNEEIYKKLKDILYNIYSCYCVILFINLCKTMTTAKQTINKKDENNNHIIIKNIIETQKINKINFLMKFENSKHSINENIIDVFKKLNVNGFNKVNFFIFECINNLDTTIYTDLREFVYNQIYLTSLVQINFLEEYRDLLNNDLNEDLKRTSHIDEEEKPAVPYLKEEPLKPYTLVLDLDETLVHYVEEEDTAYVQIRPYAEQFLSQMSKYYEIVIFTAGMQDYADLVLNELDKFNHIKYRLYRQHTTPSKGVFVKDLSKIGRPIEKMIIIDNVKENFYLQEDNGIHIKHFLGEDDDRELKYLCEDLKTLARSGISDIRRALPFIIDKMKNRLNK